MRLPRAEDLAILWVQVGDEFVEIEGTVQRVTLRAAGGINLLTGQLTRDEVRSGGEITIQFGVMRRAVLDLQEATITGPPQRLVILDEPEGGWPDALPEGS